MGHFHVEGLAQDLDPSSKEMIEEDHLVQGPDLVIGTMINYLVFFKPKCLPC